MRLAIALTLLGATSFAHAEPTKSTPKILAAGADVCKELGADAKTCKPAAKLKTKAQGAVTVYRVEGDMVRFAIAVDDGKQTLLTTALEEMTSNCGAGSCVDLMKVAPKLTEVKLGGADAIALQLDLSFEHQLNEPPKTRTRWQTHTIVLCGKGAKGPACVTQSYGNRDEKCTAKVGKTGAIEHTCTATETLAL